MYISMGDHVKAQELMQSIEVEASVAAPPVSSITGSDFPSFQHDVEHDDVEVNSNNQEGVQEEDNTSQEGSHTAV